MLKKLGWILGVAIVSSCGFPRPADVGPEDANSDVDCQLTAIEPPIASADDVITLEGTFGDAVVVNFPGGTSTLATTLGSHRARVVVPRTATRGALTITTCGSTIGHAWFRRTSYSQGLGFFRERLEQTNGAQQPPSLTTARHGHTSVVAGNSLYVLGGADDRGASGEVERATINADGSLGPFTAAPNLRLTTPRRAHSTTTVRSHLYVIGGLNETPLSSIETATVDANGEPGPLVTLATTKLATARYGHASVVAGNSLYVLGGSEAAPLSSIERATINSDGSLGSFAEVSDTSLTTARYGHTAVIIGDYLYVIGGASNNGSLNTVERAFINGDGTLGSFAIVAGGALTTPRAGHTSAILGGHLYILGGINKNNSLATIERAPFDADGTLGTFATLPAIELTTPRHGHSIRIIGNYLYALGGTSDDGTLDSIERATINPGGGLDPPTTPSGVSLLAPRSSHSVAVRGSNIYIVGGIGGAAKAVERSTLNDDASLKEFRTDANVALVADRTMPATAQIGDYLYVLGGNGSDAQSAGIERAVVNADGSLGGFTTAPGIALTVHRWSFTTAVIGTYLYVFGGSDNSGPLQSVERALIRPDGALSTFEIASGTTLTLARSGHSLAVVGDYVYIIGGLGTDGRYDSIERASIGPDGSLGQFSIVPNLRMANVRTLASAAVIGDYLYVIGGLTSDRNMTDGIERAAINADDSLGQFEVVPGSSALTARWEATTAVIENNLYIVGGWSLASSLSIIDRVDSGELR